jgi:hypothetical protein
MLPIIIPNKTNESKLEKLNFFSINIAGTHNPKIIGTNIKADSMATTGKEARD